VSFTAWLHANLCNFVMQQMCWSNVITTCCHHFAVICHRYEVVWLITTLVTAI
jgi:hypothetical protein